MRVLFGAGVEGGFSQNDSLRMLLLTLTELNSSWNDFGSAIGAIAVGDCEVDALSQDFARSLLYSVNILKAIHMVRIDARCMPAKGYAAANKRSSRPHI
jgi:hypothetical protein